MSRPEDLKSAGDAFSGPSGAGRLAARSIVRMPSDHREDALGPSAMTSTRKYVGPDVGEDREGSISSRGSLHTRDLRQEISIDGCLR